MIDQNRLYLLRKSRLNWTVIEHIIDRYKEALQYGIYPGNLPFHHCICQMYFVRTGELITRDPFFVSFKPSGVLKYGYWWPIGYNKESIQPRLQLLEDIIEYKNKNHV